MPTPQQLRSRASPAASTGVPSSPIVSAWGSTRLGVTLPTTEFGADLSALRDYAQAPEDLGFDFLMGYDQLLGSPPAAEGAREGESFAYNPLLLFSFLSSATRCVQFPCGVIVDPSALGIHVQVDPLGFDLDRQLDYAGRVRSPHAPAARLDQGLRPPTGR